MSGLVGKYWSDIFEEGGELLIMVLVIYYVSNSDLECVNLWSENYCLGWDLINVIKLYVKYMNLLVFCWDVVIFNGCSSEFMGSDVVVSENKGGYVNGCWIMSLSLNLFCEGVK